MSEIEQEATTLISTIEMTSEFMKDRPDRELLGFYLQHAAELQALHIKDIRNPENQHPFELWLTDEVRQIVNTKGRGLIRAILTSDIVGILQEPFGTRSIDPMKHEQEAQEQRTINRMSKELETVIGLPICVKGTGVDISLHDIRREDLLKQFRFMRQLSLRNEELAKKTQDRLGYCPIKFLNVYGAISYPEAKLTSDNLRYYDTQQFLVMERVIDGKHVDRDPMRVLRYSLEFDMPESFNENSGFFRADHPRLAAYVGNDQEFVGWLELKAQLKKDGTPDLTDLKERNILYRRNEEGDKEYIIIDQMPI